VISDNDSNSLIPNFGIQLHDVIDKYGDEYALFGCITNRLRGLHQLYNKQFSNNHDMQYHFDIALKLNKEHYAEVEETHGVAGLFLCFSKKTWEKVGGFVENNIACDTLFNDAIKRNKIGKIGIIKGLYLYHCYRMWENTYEEAINSIIHLQK